MTELLKINDLFWTIQGEGANAGRRSLFIRMPYCNLACAWCDTTFNAYTTLSDSDFTKFATQERGKFAVITGGEPMLNKQTPRVITLLKTLGFEIACESNGMFPILEGIDFATVSPKRFSQEKKMPWPDKTEVISDAKREPNAPVMYPAYYVHPQALERASEFRYVVDLEFDFALLDRHDTKDGRRYSLSPEFGNFKSSVARIIDYVSQNPDWRLSLQTHKWLGIP